MRALWLPEVLRAAGLTVHEYDGWRTRGSESWGPVQGLVAHATAGSPTSTDAGETRVLWVTGSVTAPAPIAQLYLSRSGEYTVGASGRCNHVRYSDVKPDSPLGQYGNANLIGIEAQNDNRGQPWPAPQLDSYQRGSAAILKHLGFPASKVAAHWEHQTGKSDPFGINMPGFRLQVGALLEGGGMALTPEEITAIARKVWEYQFADYIDVDGDGVRPNITMSHALFSARADAYRTANREPEPGVELDATALVAAMAASPEFMAALAAGLAALIPKGGTWTAT